MTIPEEYLPIGGAGREELRVFYTWTFEDAKKAQDEWSGIGGPLFRWDAAQQLKALADLYKKTGDNNILLQAISICALNDFAIPKWCSLPYLKAFRDVWHYKVKSWDDSFGRPNPKGSQVEAKRRRREKRFGVYNRIEEIKQKNPEVPIDRELFDRVGKEFGICGTLADEYYYSVKKSQVTFLESPTGETVKKLLDGYRVR